MSIANFGSFLGGLAQGQQSAEAQREKANYLAMLQKRQQAADDDVSSTRDAVFANNYMEGAQTPDPTAVFSGGLPPQQPPAPQPGQPSVPMQQPGPQGGPPPQMAQPGAGPMPPQGPPPTPYAPPQSKPMVVPPAQGGPAPGSQPMPPQAAPGQGPQQPPATDGFARAEQILNETKAALATPEAEQVAKDPKVQQATKQYHDYVKELQDAGIAPGKGKPDLVQMKRLNLLHDNLALAATDASKHVSADRKLQYEFGTKFADLKAKEQASNNVLKGREYTADEATARKRIGGAGGGDAGASFDELSQGALRNLAEDEAKLGPSVLPWSKYKGSADLVKYNNWKAANGFTSTAGSRADYKGDVASGQKLTPLADRLEAAQGTFHQNFDRAIKAGEKAGIKDNMPINQLANWLREKGGDPDTAAFLSGIATAQGEYAKLLSASTSAGGSSVEALRRASEMINPNMTLGQLKTVQKMLEADGKSVTGELRKAAKTASDRTHGSSQRGAGSAPSAGGGGGLYKAKDGKTYTQDQINDAAAQKGEDPDAFAAARGLTRGN